MPRKYIISIALIFLTLGIASAQAEPVPAVIAPSAMSDEALASYISGRLNQALKGEDHAVSQYCDATGCSVVVQ